MVMSLKDENLKDELIACLKLFDNEAQQKKLMPIIAELEKAKKPIQDDENLNIFLRRLLLKEAPELIDDPKSERLINFCLSLKYSPRFRSYRAR